MWARACRMQECADPWDGTCLWGCLPASPERERGLSPLHVGTSAGEWTTSRGNWPKLWQNKEGVGVACRTKGRDQDSITLFLRNKPFPLQTTSQISVINNETTFPTVPWAILLSFNRSRYFFASPPTWNGFVPRFSTPSASARPTGMREPELVGQEFSHTFL